MKESIKKIQFTTKVSTQCINFQDPPYFNIFFTVISSGFDEREEFELKFENINVFTALCTIPKDDEYKEEIICQISIIEYGIPHGLTLFKEPPDIKGVEIIDWKKAAEQLLFVNCYIDYTYHFNHIEKYSIDENETIYIF